MIDVCWLEQTAADVPAADDWLSAGEAERLSGMRFAEAPRRLAAGALDGEARRVSSI